MTRGKHEPAMVRFFSRVEIDPDGCWRWTGNINEMGYGTFNPGPRQKVYAHRWLYQQLRGPIQADMVLDHLCHTAVAGTCQEAASCPHRRCVNPDHLQQVTRATNGGRSTWAARTACPKGHPYDEANTYIRPDTGGRQCRACTTERLSA